MMARLVLALGCIIFVAIMFAPPILLTLSLVYNWHGFIKAICFCAVGMQFWAIVYTVYMEVGNWIGDE